MVAIRAGAREVPVLKPADVRFVRKAIFAATQRQYIHSGFISEPRKFGRVSGWARGHHEAPLGHCADRGCARHHEHVVGCYEPGV